MAQDSLRALQAWAQQVDLDLQHLLRQAMKGGACYWQAG